MTSPEINFPIHVNLHPHETVGDYADVKMLAHREGDPFLVFLPEMSPEVVPHFQAMSGGDRNLYRSYKAAYDSSQQRNGMADQNSSRGLALAEAVFNTGLVVVSAHPSWDEETKVANATVNMMGGLEPTLRQAVEVAQAELPQVASILRARDDFTADHLRGTLTTRVQAEPDFDGLGDIPCLLEIGSYHFQLVEKLRQRGFEVDTSGTTLEDLDLCYDQAIVQLLDSPFALNIDWEMLAMESLLANTVRTTTSNEKAQLIRVMLEGTERSDWPELYEDTLAELRGPVQLLRYSPHNRSK